jgi:hypothetical protein
MMEGDIQADGDTVFVSQVLMPLFNGSPAPDVPFLFSVTQAIGAGNPPPTVTFSGSFMDFVACNTVLCQPLPDGTHADGFSFDTQEQLGAGIGVTTGVGYGDFDPFDPPETVNIFAFDSSQWQLSLKENVPEPTGILASMMAVSLFLVFGKSLRQL